MEKSDYLPSSESEQTKGMVSSNNQTMTLFKDILNLNKFVQFSIVVHEFAHAYQVGLDWEGVSREQMRWYFPAGKFYQEIAPFGWRVDYSINVPKNSNKVFVDHFDSADYPKVEYYKESLDEWKEWLNVIYNEVGDQYLLDPRVTDFAIVGDYSLSDPWEWHADNLQSYVLYNLSKKLSKKEKTEMNKALKKQFPYYRYENIKYNEDLIHYFDSKFQYR